MAGCTLTRNGTCRGVKQNFHSIALINVNILQVFSVYKNISIKFYWLKKKNNVSNINININLQLINGLHKQGISTEFIGFFFQRIAIASGEKAIFHLYCEIALKKHIIFDKSETDSDELKPCIV